MNAHLHPLTNDSWACNSAPEHSAVRTSQIASVNRTISAIHAIARIAGNSITSPAATGADPLPLNVTHAMLGGIESLCDHLSYIAEEMQETAALHGDAVGVEE